MSEYNDFINLCDCYIQFTDQYTNLNLHEQELRDFCAFVKVNKPYALLKDEFDRLVHAKQEEMLGGIVTFDNGVPNAGKLFHKDSQAFVSIAGEHKVYKFSFFVLMKSFQEKNGQRQANDTRKDPGKVMMYALTVLKNLLLACIADSTTIERRMRDSISTATYRNLNEPCPYAPGSLNHLLTFVGKLAEHEKVTSFGDSMAGEGTTKKFSAGLKKFDPKTLFNSNLTGRVSESIANLDADGFLNNVGGIVADMAASVHQSVDEGDCTDQLG